MRSTSSSELGADVRVEQLAGAQQARERVGGGARRERRGRAFQLLERPHLAHRAAGPVRGDDRQVAGEVAPQPDEQSERAASLGGRHIRPRALVLGGLGRRRRHRRSAGAAATGGSAKRQRPRRRPVSLARRRLDVRLRREQRDPARRRASRVPDPRRAAGSGRGEQVEERADELVADRLRLGLRGVGRASPGRPPARRASRAAGGRIGERPRRRAVARCPAAATGPRRTRTQRERTVGRRRSSSSAHRMSVAPGGRLLERLEQRRLGVVVHAMGALDDAPRATALDGQQRELPTRPRTARLGTSCRRSGSAGPGPPGASRWRSGWLPCSTRRQPRHARHGRSPPVGADAEEPGREVERERRLAHAGRPREQQRMRGVRRRASPGPPRRRPDGRPSGSRPRVGASGLPVSPRSSRSARRPSCGSSGASGAAAARPRPARSARPSAVARRRASAAGALVGRGRPRARRASVGGRRGLRVVVRRFGGRGAVAVSEPARGRPRRGARLGAASSGASRAASVGARQPPRPHRPAASGAVGGRPARSSARGAGASPSRPASAVVPAPRSAAAGSATARAGPGASSSSSGGTSLHGSSLIRGAPPGRPGLRRPRRAWPLPPRPPPPPVPAPPLPPLRPPVAALGAGSADSG